METIEKLRGMLAKVANGGPHEWGYRDPVEGGFIADSWPFDVAAALPTLLDELERLQKENGAIREALAGIADRAAKLRQGTDDWFELTEFEIAARTALQGAADV